MLRSASPQQVIMPDSPVQELLTRLARGGDSGAESWAVVAATVPDHDQAKTAAAAQAERERQEKLDQLLGRIAKLTGHQADEANEDGGQAASGQNAGEFFPQ